MTALFELREQLKLFYTRYGAIIVRVTRSVLMLVTLLLVDTGMSYMSSISQYWLAVVIAVLCGFVPWAATVFIAAFLVIMQMYAVAVEVAACVLALCLIFVCFHYMFRSGQIWLILVTPLACFLNMPLVIPVIIGLTGSLAGCVPMIFGIVMYYLCTFVRSNTTVLASTGSLTSLGRFTQMINGLIGNSKMWFVIAACCVTLLLVYTIRKLSVDYAWLIAVGVGEMAGLVTFCIGIFGVGVSFSIVEIIVDGLAAGLAGLLLQFMLFNVDYSRAEYVQFEDDDYYYYVKAVPKIAVTRPDLQVKKINDKKKEDPDELFARRRAEGHAPARKHGSGDRS